MSAPPAEALSVGYTKRDITPGLGAPLAGRPAWGVRKAGRIRDGLFARALHLRTASGEATLVTADLVLVTRELHDAVCRAAALPSASLLLCATHTHSGLGGYWRGSLIERFMGPYEQSTLEWLASELARVAREAREHAVPATVSAATVAVKGASVNRRQRGGPVDPTLALLRFDAEGAPPVCLVGFGAHAIAGLEREPATVTADYPGEICRRLEHRGCRALFVQGAGAGTSPAWLEPSLGLEAHLARMGDALERAVDEAQQRRAPCAAGGLVARAVPLLVAVRDGHLFPRTGSGAALLELLSTPVRRLVRSMAREGLVANGGLALHLLRLGDLALLGVPSEVGPGVARELRALLHAAGIRFPLIASLCNGYAGYVHLREDYEHAPALRPLALYENAMSLGGWDMGERMVAALRAHVAGS